MRAIWKEGGRGGPNWTGRPRTKSGEGRERSGGGGGGGGGGGHWRKSRNQGTFGPLHQEGEENSEETGILSGEAPLHFKTFWSVRTLKRKPEKRKISSPFAFLITEPGLLLFCSFPCEAL